MAARSTITRTSATGRCGCRARPLLLWIWAAILIFLTAIYAWATVAFGLRFSNLTYRGVLTNGPYRFTRHPAYLSKNLYWWFATMPFIATTGSLTDSVRNTVLLGLVSAVYYWRAKTEEKHLSAEDPKYRDYSAPGCWRMRDNARVCGIGPAGCRSGVWGWRSRSYKSSSPLTA